MVLTFTNDSVFVCILNEKGVVFQEKFGVLTPELERMVGVIMEHGVTEVGMESTSVYWMPVWRVIDPYVEQKLVNPYFIRQLPGKKSDVKDAEWIATCILKGLVRGSYVPEERIQRLRQYDRRIFDLNDDIVYRLARLDAALQRCNIRLSNYVSTTDCKSYGDVVDAIARGETSPDALLRCVHGRIVNRHGADVIRSALTGVVTPVDVDVIRQLREEIELARRHRDECQRRMDGLCSEWFPEQYANLQTIPGVKAGSPTATSRGMPTPPDGGDCIYRTL